MFPFDIEIADTYIEEKDPVEYGINFNTGQLTGEIVTGLEAVKVWAWLALQSARYRYEQYSHNYGHDLEDLIGEVHSNEYLDSEINRMVNDALMVNPFITGVTITDYSLIRDKITIYVTISTKWGDGDINV